MDKDAFQLNIDGVQDLVSNPANKLGDDFSTQEGLVSDTIDELELDMSDSELLLLARQYENKYSPYQAKLIPRQKQNKAYLLGTQKQGTKTIPSNLLFEATATFVPQALAKNPEPVVWSDNTEEGKIASNDLKTMLQFHADVLTLRKKLGVMVWHWSVYLIGVIKHGWDKEINDITSKIRRPSNFLFDPDGYVDEYGDFTGWTGERCQLTASEVAEYYPKHADYVKESVEDKMGSIVTYTEWWSADNKYSFTTYKDVVLEKHKNEFFNYDKEKTNHFAVPKKPYTFLSVFSLQDQPHDFTNLIEQNIANQDRINERDYQVEKNLKHGNNAIAVSDINFNSETAHQAADALEKGDPILVSGKIEGAILRLPANALPNGVLEAQQIDKDTLRSIYGTQGLSAQQPDENTTARGMILNQSHDSSRIGGGIGDALEQVADNIFNWWTQLYYVFYDEVHYAPIMGQASAVEYAQIMMVGNGRKFVVSVAPNSMQPKDEITEMNQAIQLAEGGWLDPINLFKKLNYPDPMETAKAVTLFRVNPQVYLMQYFPEHAQAVQQSQQSQGQEIPEQGGTPPQPLSEAPASADLSQVPINQGASLPQ